MKYLWISIVISLLLGVMPSLVEGADSNQLQGKNHQSSGQQIVWQKWSDDIFSKAKNSNRYILLDLEAIWCHWCHIMDEKTYKDPAIIRLVNERFIPVKVDQDSRPDLSYRYDDYGWPATVIFDPTGKERAIW